MSPRYLRLRLDEQTFALVHLAAGARQSSVTAWIQVAIRAELQHQAAKGGPEGAPLAARVGAARRAGTPRLPGAGPRTTK